MQNWIYLEKKYIAACTCSQHVMHLFLTHYLLQKQVRKKKRNEIWVFQIPMFSLQDFSKYRVLRIGSYSMYMKPHKIIITSLI